MDFIFKSKFLFYGTLIKTLDHEITQMTWMTDAEVFYRQLDKDISTEVARREIVTKPFNGQTLYKLEVGFSFPFENYFLTQQIKHASIGYQRG